MSDRQERESRPATERDEAAPDPDPEPTRDDAVVRAAEASAEAAKTVDDIDELLDDVDQSLRGTLGFSPDEVVDDAELERRAQEMVSQYQQKGGQ